MMVNEDESLSEFINQEAIREVEKEIKELEKKYDGSSEADYNTMKENESSNPYRNSTF